MPLSALDPAPDERRRFRLPADPLREALAVWALVLALLAVCKAVLRFPWGGSITGALAVALFLWAPGEAARRAGRAEEDYGLDLRRWKGDALFALGVMLVVFPIFTGGFLLFAHRPELFLPCELVERLTPYTCTGLRVQEFRWRLPSGMLDLVAGNVAVAIGEEFFYRGYVQERLERRWPASVRLLGAPFGRAALVQTVLFALGHLLTPATFRLGTFFPGLLFTWMATRRRRVVAPAVVHAASNVLIAALEASSGFRP